MGTHMFTLTRHEITALADLAAVADAQAITLEQRTTATWTITRAVLPDGSVRHLGPKQDAPKWLVEV